MSTNLWVYEKATGKWMLDFRDPSVYLTDKVNYAVADLGDKAPIPDPVLERATILGARRPATALEIQEAQAEQKTAVTGTVFEGQRALVAAILKVVLGRDATGAELTAVKVEYTKLA